MSAPQNLCRSSPLWTAVLVSAACSGIACQKLSDEPDVKRMPKAAPAPDPSIPADLHIKVTVDGAEGLAIDGTLLRGLSPDFADGERRAFDLVRLIGDSAKRPKAKLGVTAERGPEVVMDPPAAEGDWIPVLLISRRGDVVATMLDPKAPFPEYHGQGGRLGRRGDPVPRVEGVKRIRVFVPPQ